MKSGFGTPAVIPAKAGIQRLSKALAAGSRRHDGADERRGRITGHFALHQQVLLASRQLLIERVAAMAETCIAALAAGGKLLLCGNGGSAADAQHIAAELVGRFKTERAPLPAVALTTDSSALTAIGNDYGFDEVFARQITALARPGDVLIALSTSGESRNVRRAVEAARTARCRVLAFAGRDGGWLGANADLAAVVPCADTAVIQEMHITLGHALCAALDEWAAPRRL